MFHCSYLQYIKARGYEMMFIWACPPLAVSGWGGQLFWVWVLWLRLGWGSEVQGCWLKRADVLQSGCVCGRYKCAHWLSDLFGWRGWAVTCCV
jgi:hypothetical protein